MPNRTLCITIPHRLSQEQAKSRIQCAIADARRTYAGKFTDVHETWTGDQMDFRLTAMGQQISGRIEVLPQDVKLEVDLPWMLAMLAGRYKKRVEEEGRRLLEDK